MTSKINHGTFEVVLRSHLKYIHDGEELNWDGDLRLLGLDSMAAIKLMLELEDMFSVMLPDEYLVEETFATARALCTALERASELNGMHQSIGDT